MLDIRILSLSYSYKYINIIYHGNVLLLNYIILYVNQTFDISFTFIFLLLLHINSVAKCQSLIEETLASVLSDARYNYTQLSVTVHRVGRYIQLI